MIIENADRWYSITSRPLDQAMGSASFLMEYIKTKRCQPNCCDKTNRQLQQLFLHLEKTKSLIG
jgi:hypothetical protein